MEATNLADAIRHTKARVQADEQSRPSTELAPYARLERKEVRVRADQLEKLAAIVRELMRSRRVKAERITENTLIRVAIDLLVAHQDQLQGSTEAQLRASVTTRLRNSQAPRPSRSGTSQASDTRPFGLPAPREGGVGIGSAQ